MCRKIIELNKKKKTPSICERQHKASAAETSREQPCHMEAQKQALKN